MHTPFFHKKLLKLTPEQRKNLQYCSDCKQNTYIPDGQKNCENCHDKRGEMRSEKKNRTNKIKCRAYQNDGSKCNISRNLKDGYCSNKSHQEQNKYPLSFTIKKGKIIWDKETMKQCTMCRLYKDKRLFISNDDKDHKQCNACREERKKRDSEKITIDTDTS